MSITKQLLGLIDFHSIFFYRLLWKSVGLINCLVTVPVLQYLYLLWCSSEERHLYRFWNNFRVSTSHDDRILIFGWTNPFDYCAQMQWIKKRFINHDVCLCTDSPKCNNSWVLVIRAPRWRIIQLWELRSKVHRISTERK